MSGPQGSQGGIEAEVLEVTSKYHRVVTAVVDAVNQWPDGRLMAGLSFDRVQMHSDRGTFVYEIFRERKTVWVRDHSMSNEAESHSRGWALDGSDVERLADNLAYYLDWHSTAAIKRAHAKFKVALLKNAALSHEIDLGHEE